MPLLSVSQQLPGTKGTPRKECTLKDGISKSKTKRRQEWLEVGKEQPECIVGDLTWKLRHTLTKRCASSVEYQMRAWRRKCAHFSSTLPLFHSRDSLHYCVSGFLSHLKLYIKHFPFTSRCCFPDPMSLISE